MPSLFDGYQIPDSTFDEMFESPGVPRPWLKRVLDALGASSPDDFARSQTLAELSMLQQGITFSVYSDNRGTEKVFPFDLVPRIIAAHDWALLDNGLTQ